MEDHNLAPISPEERIEPESKSCKECGEPAVDFCKHCGQEYCLSHRSKYQPALCHNCVSDSNLTIETAPITDPDGTEHKGRQFRLIGEGWPRAVQKLHDLSDVELEDYIVELTTRLKEAQAKLDYTKILLAAAEFEKSHNEWSRSIAARKRREKLEQGAVKLNKKKFKMAAKADPDLKMAELLGITLPQYQQLKTMLGKKN